jgi:uncharacterized protein (DUF1330 family)
MVMRRGYNSVLILAAGVAIGLAASSAIRAQQPKAPAGYVVAEVKVNDPTTFKEYAAQVPATLAPFGGRYLARAGKITPVEGDPPKGNIVVIAFDSVGQAEAWEHSQAYEAIKPLRHKSAISRIFIVQGVATQ